MARRPRDVYVLGRQRDAPEGEGTDAARDPPVGRLGRYRASDGSAGAPVGLDLDRPHAALIVGKRGSGKSHTLGVIAEGAIAARGVAPVVCDPMGGLDGLAEAGAEVIAAPTIRADALAPPRWPRLLGLDPSGPAGTLVWQAAAAATTLSGMQEYVEDADAASPARRGASNHLGLAASWDVFGARGLTARDLRRTGGTVLDLSGLPPAPTNAVVAALVRGLYDDQVAADDTARRPLPWLLLDEVHAFFDGIATPALRTVLTRGRAPGISLVAATQRPCALPDVAVSQADLLIAHRLTAEPDVAALAAAAPTYLRGTLRDRLPDETGCAVIVDDADESVNGVRIRQRRTPHGGESPRAVDGRARTGTCE